MCLLERLESWDANAIHCTTGTHAHADNPAHRRWAIAEPDRVRAGPRAARRLLATEGRSPRQAFWRVRAMCVLPSNASTTSPACCTHAQRISGDVSQILYEFAVKDAHGRPLAARAVVVWALAQEATS
jgi:predicted hotdog family 3-hydroxylacyl-ACP dehydratase